MSAVLTRAPKPGSPERDTVDKAHAQLLSVRSALEELAGLDMAAYCRVMAAGCGVGCLRPADCSWLGSHRSEKWRWRCWSWCVLASCCVQDGYTERQYQHR